MIDGSALPRVQNFKLAIDEGNCHFRFADGFLLDFEGISAVRYIEYRPTVMLPRNIEVLCAECFSCCRSLLSFTFESRSRLTRIEVKAFHDCSSLESICIPASVEILCQECFAGCRSLSSFTFETGSNLVQIEARAFSMCCVLTSILIPLSIRCLSEDWAMESSFCVVAFESSISLKTMFETGNIDLSGDFQIVIAECECELSFPGYSVDIGFGLPNYIHLMKAEDERVKFTS
jgi:hypothetical protein